MDYKMIHYTVERSIATITLDYAPTLNALDMNMSLEVESALHEAACRRRACLQRRRRYPLHEGALR